MTGVGPGLSASMARRFAREGYAVALVARHAAFIEELAQEISRAGGNALVADVSHPSEVEAAVKRVRAELGSVGVLLHNASSSAATACLERRWKISKAPGGSRR
ncbi:MAG: SDR family NAD(P)-dependent oxidoreductase [Chthoniobacterales bacterium]